MSSPRRFALIFFVDGVGLGDDDAATNPFATAELPHLTDLLGEKWWVHGRGPIVTDRATLRPTDPNLDVTGRPQSATGQATILTGRNVPAAIGRHYGPKPNAAVREQIDTAGTLFSRTAARDGPTAAALLSPYPPGYFNAVHSGKRLYSAVPYAADRAGVRLRTDIDLQEGRAVSPGFTNDGWRKQLGYEHLPVIAPHEAGRRLARLAQQHTFSFFEHWPSDRLGHRGSLAAARDHLELIDAAVGGLLAAWPPQADEGLLIITSDHGNIEDKSQRQHTTNPVPTIVVGREHAAYASAVHTLADIAPTVGRFLQL